MDKKRVKDYILITMETNIKVNGWVIRRMGLVLIGMQVQVIVMKEIGRIIWSKEEGDINIVMVIYMKDHLWMEWRMEEENFSGNLESYMKESGVRIWWMEWVLLSIKMASKKESNLEWMPLRKYKINLLDEYYVKINKIDSKKELLFKY